MRLLKGLTWLAVIAVIGWGAYWFVGSRAIDRAIATGLASVPEVSVEGYNVSGFPNRFDITFDQPRLTSGDVAWSSPFVQLFALTYRLNHLIAVFAPDQTVTIGGEVLAIHSSDMRASVVAEASSDLPLARTSLIAQDVSLTTRDRSFQADTAQIASRIIAPSVHAVAVRLENAFPDGDLIDLFDPARIWPRAFTLLRLDGEVTLSRPLDRHLAEGGPQPEIQDLTLTAARIGWAGTDIALEGRLSLDAQGFPTGDARLQITGWQALVQMLDAAGLLPAGNRATIDAALAAMVSREDPDRIDAAFAIVSGEVRVGPLVIARLPRLR